MFTLRALAAQTVGTVNGAAIQGLGQLQRMIILLDITASTHEAADTLDVYVDFSMDNLIWYNAVHFTQKAGNTAAIREIAVLDPAAPGAVVINVTADAASGVVRPAIFGPYCRVRSVAVEGNADADVSHTFAVYGYGQTYRVPFE